MRRSYTKQRRFDFKKLGTVAFSLFVLFVAFRILTPPTAELARIESPDGSRTARLRRFAYYENQPSYKIDYRDADKFAWLNLFHLPSYTNAPPELHRPSIEWSPDSEYLFFKINGTSIWYHAFQ